MNDTSGLTDSFIWNLKVYDYPKILYPLSNFEYNLKENASSILNFSVNHTIQDNLSYELIINNVIRNSTINYGNGTNFLWSFTPNFSDETTCTGTLNLTLNVSNGKLSNSTTWNVTINHTNYPLSFISNISDTTLTSLTLSDYFYDLDAEDSCVNQTIGFKHALLNSSGGAITVSVVNWTNGTNPTISFSSSSSGKANYSITAYEFNSTYGSSILRNITSNNFSVQLTVTSVSTPTPTTGGGGTRIVPVSLKIIVPGPLSAYQNERIVVPLKLVNDGSRLLSGISLSGLVAKNNSLNNNLKISFDKIYIDSLNVGEEENVTMTIFIDTNESGMFEITINANVSNPKYSDWGKFYLNVNEIESLKDRIVFAQEFLENNPECIELEELLDEAKIYFEKGDFANTIIKINMAIDGCKTAISQQARAKRKEPVEDNLYRYLIITTLIVFLLGMGYYSYKRVKMKRAIFNGIELKEKGLNKNFILIFLGLIAVSLLFINKKITGFVSGTGGESNGFVFILILFILLLFVFLFHKKDISLNVYSKKRKKKTKNSVHSLNGKYVYDSEGEYIGKVKEIVLGGSKIDSLKIELNSKIKKEKKLKGIIINYKDVIDVSEIVLIKGGCFERGISQRKDEKSG